MGTKVRDLDQTRIVSAYFIFSRLELRKHSNQVFRPVVILTQEAPLGRGGTRFTGVSSLWERNGQERQRSNWIDFCHTVIEKRNLFFHEGRHILKKM